VETLSSNLENIEETDNNAFKEEDYITYLMKSYEDEFYGENKNQSYIQDIQDIKDKKLSFNDRGTEGVYMSHRVFEDWIYFCNTIPKPTCELTEKALLVFMMNYPKKNLLLDINIVEEKTKTSQQQLQDTILCSYLKSWMDKVNEQLQRGTLDNYPQIWDNFIKYCEQASTFKNPSERLVKLIEKATLLL